MRQKQEHGMETIMTECFSTERITEDVIHEPPARNGQPDSKMSPHPVAPSIIKWHGRLESLTHHTDLR